MAKRDLSKLTKEQKLELIQALERKEQIEKRRRNKFKPTDKQRTILESTAKIKISTAGNGFGKSALGVNLLHARCTGYESWSGKTTKVPIKAVVLLDNPSKIDAVWRTEYNKWHDLQEIKEDKQGSPHVKMWTFKNGSTVRFMTQEMDQLNFESAQFDLLIIDEPCTRPQWVGLMRGQREKGVQAETIMIGTPISHEHQWIKQDLIEPAKEGKLRDVEWFTGSSYDNNANLDSEYLERFESLLTDAEKRVRLHGEFSAMESSVFGHLMAQHTHLMSKDAIQWDYSWPVVVAIDPHPSKAHVAVMVGRRPIDDKLFVLKEIEGKETARNFAKLLLNWTAGYNVQDWVCDSLGSSESTGQEGFKSFIQVLNECGVRARATTYQDKQHQDAVERIREMLAFEDSGPPLFEKSPRLRFLDGTAYKAYRELANITWQYNKNEAINKPRLNSSKLDYFSALTYALSSRILAKTFGNYGIIYNKAGSTAGQGASYAQGLGITTSKGNVKNKPMKRFYTRTGYSRDEDE